MQQSAILQSYFKYGQCNTHRETQNVKWIQPMEWARKWAHTHAARDKMYQT